MANTTVRNKPEIPPGGGTVVTTGVKSLRTAGANRPKLDGEILLKASGDAELRQGDKTIEVGTKYTRLFLLMG